MRFPFSPSWKKFDAEPPGSGQFHYLFEKDVEPHWRRETYANLNLGRKMAVRFYWYCAELSNGSLPQYFWNSAGEFVFDQIADFTVVGATESGRILTEGAHKIFGGELPPRQIEERRRLIVEYYGTHPFNDDDDKERLAILEGKDDLLLETDQLSMLRHPTACRLCSWWREHPEFFTRLG